ncbi:filamentous hemagglutinin N-terminal domain-containing protein [uncultured Nostoc sp.]|uniref:two-partner secretion domain-containing protein n=1 Tax=uncultured Nostoc sp. TaxID=340711 RepID=UPI0035CB2C81
MTLNETAHSHILLIGGIFLLCLAEFTPTQAQNVPVADTTLPINSVVNPPKDNISAITGGTVAGRNLFHSFQQFNIGEGQTADFVSPSAAIENILIRVTGGSGSQIMGTLSTSGVSNPNLFLINPKGIVFGRNAKLDIRSSFIATTADAIDFGNQGFFSASAPNNPELLKVNPSAFLFNQIANQPINSIEVNGASLSVDNGQNLLLVGGNVTLDNNAILTAQDSRIELGGVTGSTTVKLNVEANTLRSNYPALVQRADVSLTNSQVQVTGEGEGSIAINAESLNMNNSSLETQTAQISVQANKFVSLASSSITTITEKSVGNASNINIQTGSLDLTNNSNLIIRNEGEGRIGNVTIKAQNIVSVDNSLVESQAYELQDAGAINITAGKVTLTNGGVISSNTWGKGKGGNITVNASSVNISGVNADPILGYSSGLETSSEGENSGQGGSINVNTKELSLSDGGVLIARTRNASPGGKITVNANTFEATDGGQVITTTFGTGRAGDITVTATDWVKISGSDSTYFDRFQQQKYPTIVDNDDPASGLLANVQGNQIANAGNILVQAASINLDNQGVISATTTSGEGGNIELQPHDLLLMRRGSQISTTAGTQGSGGNGGNITINAPSGFIIAVPSENSDITANAYTGSGGRVDIKANGIYGIEFRKSSTPLSDITASSEFGRQGIVELNTPGIDPNSGLVELPTVPVDTQVAQGCYSPGYAQSSFVITGRGGLPSNPREAFSNDTVQSEWATLVSSSHNRQPQAASKDSLISMPAPIIEATGWVTNSKGDIILITNPHSATPHSSGQPSTACGISTSAHEH